VIHNLLAEVERAAAEEALDFKGIKRGDHWEGAHIKTSGSIAAVLDPDVTPVAGTAWLFAGAEIDGKLDTLVIDEAGHFSLADVWGAQIRLSRCCGVFVDESAEAVASVEVVRRVGADKA